MRRFAVSVLLLAATVVAPFSATAAVLPQNDAGSGGDAPNVATASFRIEPGIVYEGTIEGIALDEQDWYAFDATAGTRMEAAASSPLGCIHLYDGAGTELAFSCTFGVVGRAVAVAPTTDTYYVLYSYLEPHPYRFSLGLDALAPSPLPVDTDALLGSTDPLPAVAPATEAGPHSVVAVVDTGVNPYHQFFRAPALTAHPSNWLPGFPASATTVDLSLDEPNYDTARAADAATLAGLTRSTYDPATDTFDTHLYTFPGTRVVGAVSFGEYLDTPVDAVPVDRLPVLDDYGHGTHSAGLAAGANLPAADGDVLVVMVEVGKADFVNGVRWAARQPWIDAISVSLGLLANAPVTTSVAGNRNEMEWATYEASRNGKPVFMASGNGFSDSGVTPDHCTTYTSPYTGPAWVTRVGAADHGDGSPTWWHCVPVEAVARTDVQSPVYNQTTGSSLATGTSAATPNAAGHYAQLLLDGRRAGSTATRDSVLEHLLHAAQPVPVSPGAHDPSVYPVSLADQGYGLVDAAAVDAARSRLVAGSGPAPRPETEAWFAADAAIRTSLWGPGSATDGERPVVPPVPGEDDVIVQDDAGSGGDAPDVVGTGVPILPGVKYTGSFTGGAFGIVGDISDWYSFSGTAGDVINVRVSALESCVDLVSPSGVHVFPATCSEGYALQANRSVTLAETGTWYLNLATFTPGPYTFAIGRSAAAPAVFP